MALFFTADTHFGHAKIIRLCARPFADVDQMDAELVARWNAVVGDGDEVWHLGDFAWKHPTDYFDRLNGRKHLVFGNHDEKHRPTLRGIGWESMHDYAEIFPRRHMRIVLCHYAMRVWNGSRRGRSYQFYGHSHGGLTPYRNALDVGVDCWGYRPVSLDEALAHMQDRGTNS